MDFQFHKESARYATAFAVLIGIIFFFWDTAIYHIEKFVFDEGILNYQDIPLIKRQPSKPVYEGLSKETIIYSSSSEVLKKRDALAREEKDFLFADLNDMELQIYQKGSATQSFKILSKGREGGFFETPSGYYSIHYKEKNHFSSIGEVWMPWSMHFFGNYFIHGWPYYPDGSPVAETFSGGCIRLSDDDANQIFKVAKAGMPVLVYAGTSTPPLEVTYFRKIEDQKKKIIPQVFAEAVLAADFETGQILFEKNADAAYPIASITKLMSTLAAMETINRFKVLTITKDVLAELGDSAGLLEGEQFRAEDLVYPLLLTSSNDIAKLYDKESFGLVKAMNQKAEALGMRNASFKDASGISASNTASTKDIFKLLQFLSTHKKPIFTISGLREYTLESVNKKKRHIWINVNWPLNDDRFIGGKSGKISEAGETMAGVYKVRFPEFEERHIAIIVFGSENRIKDVNSVIDYLATNLVYGAASLAKEKEKKPIIIRQGASIFEAIKGLGIVE